MRPLNRALTWLLKNDPELIALGVTGVFRKIAPQRQTPKGPAEQLTPFIIFQKQGGTNRHTHDRKTARRLIYLVKAVDEGNSSDRADQIDDRIEELLDMNTLGVEGHTVQSILRRDDVDYTEVVGAITYQHVGANYQILIN